MSRNALQCNKICKRRCKTNLPTRKVSQGQIKGRFLVSPSGQQQVAAPFYLSAKTAKDSKDSKIRSGLAKCVAIQADSVLWPGAAVCLAPCRRQPRTLCRVGSRPIVDTSTARDRTGTRPGQRFEIGILEQVGATQGWFGSANFAASRDHWVLGAGTNLGGCQPNLAITCVLGVNHDMRRGAGRVMFLVLGLALAPWQA